MFQIIFFSGVLKAQGVFISVLPFMLTCISYLCFYRIGDTLARCSIKRTIKRDIRILREEHSKSRSAYNRKKIRDIVAKMHKEHDSL